MTGRLCSGNKGDAPAGQRPYLPIPNSDRRPAGGKMGHSRWTDPGGFIRLGLEGQSWRLQLQEESSAWASGPDLFIIPRAACLQLENPHLDPVTRSPPGSRGCRGSPGRGVAQPFTAPAAPAASGAGRGWGWARLPFLTARPFPRSHRGQEHLLLGRAEPAARPRGVGTGGRQAPPPASRRCQATA